MLEPNELSQLAQTHTHPNPTMSLYLALDQQRDKRLLTLGDMIKRKEQSMATNGHQEAWERLAEDRQRVTRFIENLPGSPGRGLALFSCAQADLWQAYTLAVPVANQLELGPSPYIRPLAALAGDLVRTITVLADRKGMRFFFSHLGVLSELDDLEMDEDEGVSERDGGAGRAGDSHLDRRANQAMARHTKAAAQHLRRLADKYDVRQILLAGSRAEALAEALPAQMRALVSGELELETSATEAQVGEAVARHQSAARLSRQQDALAELADSVAAGGRATAGLNEVLASLYESKVHTLFVRRGFMASGGICPTCGRLRHMAGTCPLCGQPMAPVDDVVNLAVGRALHSGAALEQINGDSPLDNMGGIAAMLRY